MSIAEVIVKKTYAGHTWSNTYGIQIGANTTSPPTDADLVTAGANATFSAGTTASGATTNVLQAIVAFERLLYASDITFTNVLVTDGKRNTGPNASTEYASIPMSIPGALAALTTPVEPGGVTLMLHRVPVGFSHKPGRLFLRAVLANSAVIVGGPRMIQWVNASTQANWQSALNAGMNAGLTQYLSGGANAATAQCVLPLYITPKMFAANPTGPKVGTLYGVVSLSAITLVGPVLHQVQRGRKRKKTV